MKKKKEHNWGLLILFVVLILTIVFVIYYNKMLNKPQEIVEKKEEKTYSEEQINELYNLIKLTYEEESAMTKEDLTYLETTLTRDKFSDELKISIGLKNQSDKNFGTEKISKPITDNQGYTYSGKYIKSEFIKEQLNKIIGPVTFNNKTITLVNKKYVYDAKLDIYRVYEKKYTSDIEKVTYIETEWDEENIYITEYVAYTKINEKPQTSYTRHNSLLPINITEKNIIENLDIIDKYKYTFNYNTNVKKFYLVKIEYLK